MPLCLNLGSFVDVIRLPHWINLDILPLQQHMPPGANFMQHDITRGLPYLENSVELIRASHVLEHVTLEQAHGVLKECYRVLEHEGVLRAVVPDAQKMARAYIGNKMDARFGVIQPEEFRNAPTECEKFSRLMFSGDYAHRAVYDNDMLANFMEQAGFTVIGHMAPNDSMSARMQRETEDQHIEVSLFVEGKKR